MAQAKAQFFAVRWGDARWPNGDYNGGAAETEHDQSKPLIGKENNCRISNKVISPRAACIDTYGTAAPNMWFKPLGTRVQVLRTASRIRPLLNGPDGWTRLVSPAK